MNRLLLLFLLLVAPLFLMNWSSEKAKKTTINDYPKGYFQLPVGHEISLSGTFGELRPNHFHAGIDIRPSRNGSPEPIFAAAEGYVVRIKVQAGGYGNALYIAHPNGYTTLYAHLERFAPQIQEYVKKIQYQQQSFEIDIRPSVSDLPIQKGQEVATMGNTGSSQGTHLHFEIRNSTTDQVINPLLFGLPLADNLAPTMSALRVYAIDANKNVVETRNFSLRKKGEVYNIEGIDTLTLQNSIVGFGLKTYDKHDRESGDNGVYSIEMLENDNVAYRFKTETFAFDESRYINAHMDYVEQTRQKSYFNRTHLLPNNRLSMYDNVLNSGYVSLMAEPKKVQMQVKDLAGNTAILKFFVKKADVPSEPIAYIGEYRYELPCNQENMIKEGNLSVYLPNGALYENLRLRYGISNDRSYGSFSPTFHIQDPQTPLHDAMQVGIQANDFPAELRAKAFIGYCSSTESRVYNIGGEWQNDILTAKIERFGNFCIRIDTTPPTIRAIAFEDEIITTVRGKRGKKIQKVKQRGDKLKFRISDNYSVLGRNAADLTYRGMIDGNWVLMELDGKSDVLTYRFDENLSDGTHHFRLEVADNRGNVAVFEDDFER